MTTNRDLPTPSLKFATAAPDDAPETKGTVAYFQPEVLVWSVSANPRGGLYHYVSASGPRTRTSGWAERSWTVGGVGDDRPAWLLLPIEQLACANLAVERLMACQDAPRTDDAGPS